MPAELPPSAAVMQLIGGAWVSHLVAAACHLNLPDHLQAGPKSTADLAKITKTHEPSLYRMLRALASLGVFKETEPRTFAPTPMSEALITKDAGSMRAMAIFVDDKAHRDAWVHILQSVRTGETAFKFAHGEHFFPYLQQHHELGHRFDQAMSSFASVTHQAVIKAYDFSKFKCLVDVGGGHGSFLADILKANPKLRGILFDQPQVIEGAKKQPFLTTGDVAKRAELKAGSFFESAPAGGDAYIMKHIIHDWSDEHCRTILGHIHRVMPAGGKLLVVENVIKPGNDPDFGKLLDLEMLAMTDGGKERTEAEFATLFASAGFKFNRVYGSDSPICVVEGVKAG